MLEVELAQIILRSELLVTEDEEFINNYILTEQTLEEYKTEQEGGGSAMQGTSSGWQSRLGGHTPMSR